MSRFVGAIAVRKCAVSMIASPIRRMGHLVGGCRRESSRRRLVAGADGVGHSSSAHRLIAALHAPHAIQTRSPSRPLSRSPQRRGNDCELDFDRRVFAVGLEIAGTTKVGFERVLVGGVALEQLGNCGACGCL